jgi:membrane-associated phospholipid phosphatase
VAGGTLWGAGFAVLGYLAGASYHRVENVASQAGLILLGVIVAGLIASRLLRHFAARSPGLEAIGDRLAALPPLAWVRRRFPAQVAWGRRRLDTRSPRGFWLTFTVAAGALAAWAFGGLTQDVTGHDDTVLADPHVTAWVVAHRIGWLTATLQVLTWLGSTAVIIPAGLAIGLYFVIRRRDWQPLVLLMATVAGAIVLYDIGKALVGRPRPPAKIWIGHYTGAAFPSGHATQSVAFYAMLAIVLGAGLSVRRRAILWSAAALVVFIVGASRIYLGAHWLTDVLAGYALGACWVAIVVAVLLIRWSGTGRVRPAREPGHAPTRRAGPCQLRFLSSVATMVRILWIGTRRMPLSWQIRVKDRTRFRGSTGLPVRVVNTRPVSAQQRPRLARSVSWAWPSLPPGASGQLAGVSRSRRIMICAVLMDHILATGKLLTTR